MKKAMNNKEVKEFLDLVKKEYNLELHKKERYEIFENIEKKDLNYKVVLINNMPKFFYYENKIIPTLKLILENNFLKKITIDMGAIKFIASGADVMRPGIVYVDDEIEKDSIVSIIDVNNKKPLAIGITLYSGEEIKNMGSGKVIKNIHYVGDMIWNFN
ncbi:MAG: DUF1947 domain-containing protein [Candidatus Woesearchaeota archaeon]